ncbi:unnamed protein product, partial [marine sediment metagenome]
MGQLIDAVNQNKNLSMFSDQNPPEDWRGLDDKMFPESVKKMLWSEEGKVRGRMRRRVYAPAIADAIEELTYAYNPGSLLKAYDNINFTLKIAGFYNPLVMTKNDAVQLWRAAGTRGLINLPKAAKIWYEKGPEYMKLRDNGLFNNVVTLTPSVTEHANQLLNKIRDHWGLRAANKAARWINPKNLITDFNEMTTWNMDEVFRIASYNAAKKLPMSKGMSDFEIIEMA